MKPQLTKAQLKVRVLEEAKQMIKGGGVQLTLSECKKEAEKVFREEFEII